MAATPQLDATARVFVHGHFHFQSRTLWKIIQNKEPNLTPEQHFNLLDNAATEKGSVCRQLTRLMEVLKVFSVILYFNWYPSPSLLIIDLSFSIHHLSSGYAPLMSEQEKRGLK